MTRLALPQSAMLTYLSRVIYLHVIKLSENAEET